jgi:long-chain fatty acid transport protein
VSHNQSVAHGFGKRCGRTQDQATGYQRHYKNCSAPIHILPKELPEKSELIKIILFHINVKLFTEDYSMLKRLLIIVLAIIMFSAATFASTDLPAIFDARGLALGGAGTAYVDNATAAFYNPACLENIDKLSLSLGFSPYMPSMTVPLNGPNTAVESTTTVAPLFFAGGGWRLPFYDRVVVGLAAYPTAGMGGAFENLPAFGGENIEMGIYMLETTIPVSIRIIDGLSIAFAWRMTYINQTSKLFVPDGAGGFMPLNQGMSGMDAAGFSAGIYYQANDWIQLGMAWRSKISIDMTGESDVFGGTFDTESEFKAPDSIRLGVAVKPIEGLLVALDLKYLTYSDTNKEMTSVIKGTPMGDQPSTVPLNWEDVFAGHLGVEYYLTSYLPIRLGYSLSKSATPKKTASFMTTSPGLLHSLHGGLGLVFEKWSVDAGAFYVFNTDGQVSETPVNSFEGEYLLSGLMFALSGNYNF